MGEGFKDIPLLEGKDAERFIEQMNNAKRKPQSEIDKMGANYERIAGKEIKIHLTKGKIAVLTYPINITQDDITILLEFIRNNF